MTTKYYIDLDGNYIGGFSHGNPDIPVECIEVNLPPPHAWQKYDTQTSVWLPLTEEQLDNLQI